MFVARQFLSRTYLHDMNRVGLVGLVIGFGNYSENARIVERTACDKIRKIFAGSRCLITVQQNRELTKMRCNDERVHRLN